MEHVVLACRALLAVIFTVSVLGKIRRREDYRRFADTVGRLAPVRLPLPGGITGARIAVLVLAAEAAVPLLAAVPGTAGWGLLLGAVLLLVFAGVLARAVHTGYGGACRCFGDSGRPVGRAQVVRNLLLGTAALVGAGLAVRGGAAGAVGAEGPPRRSSPGPCSE
ncbi:MauE/DoxX family redox-associated membrane protein [Planomonospora algeriensis]